MTLKKLSEIESEIEGLRGELKKIQAKIKRKMLRRDDVFRKVNAENYGSIEWLVNNPNAPGQYDALRDWMGENFGGEYNGVTACGFYAGIGQQAFGFMVLNYDGESKPEYITSIHKFVDLVLPVLKPVSDGRVGFTYATGQYSGIFDIEYIFEDGTWWTSNTVYSRKRDEVKWESLDDALSFAVKMAAKIDD